MPCADFDEPTSSLDDDEVEKLFVLMRRLRDEGVQVLSLSPISLNRYMQSATELQFFVTANWWENMRRRIFRE